MAEFWRTKGFKLLYSEWNKKLEANGFKDAEIDLKCGRNLRQRAANSYRQASELERQSRLEYYCFIGHLVSITEFPNELELYVMTRHAEGAKIKEILSEINSRGISRERQTIRYIIRRWQTKWGVKTWSLKQQNLKK